ncbi:antitoxin VapB family protein [Candidatus Woesearchaeota archaeon]|nr:antitoxin VapB family protein [Candidatus Woesearchaeota archaeon]
MARTIMVSNEAYSELKKRKTGAQSFSDVILESIGKGKAKTVKELVDRFGGILKGDTEYDKLMPEVKKMWAEWDKKLQEQLEEESA